MYAYMRARNKSKVALASIIISAMTTGFVGTSLSWDRDADPNHRRNNPAFYGYIQNDPTSRMFTFLTMFAITVCHILMKTMATALLMIVNSTWLLMFMIGDMSLFMLMKIARGELRYWLNLSGALGWFASCLIRVFVKQLVDFTCCFHFRHP